MSDTEIRFIQQLIQKLNTHELTQADLVAGIKLMQEEAAILLSTRRDKDYTWLEAVLRIIVYILEKRQLHLDYYDLRYISGLLPQGLLDRRLERLQAIN